MIRTSLYRWFRTPGPFGWWVIALLLVMTAAISAGLSYGR